MNVGEAMTKTIDENAGLVGSTKLRVYVPVAIWLYVIDGHLKLVYVVDPMMAAEVVAGVM